MTLIIPYSHYYWVGGPPKVSRLRHDGSAGRGRARQPAEAGSLGLGSRHGV